jgi:hypothetical protein
MIKILETGLSSSTIFLNTNSTMKKCSKTYRMMHLFHPVIKWKKSTRLIVRGSDKIIDRYSRKIIGRESGRIINTDLEMITSRVSARTSMMAILITRMVPNRNLMKELMSSRITAIETSRLRWDPKVIWSRLRRKRKMMIWRMKKDYLTEDR